MPFIGQPEGLQRARSPINFPIYYDDVAVSLDRVRLDIYIWTGARGSRPASPQYQIDRTAFADNRVNFDIAPFVRDYFTEIADKVYVSSVQSTSTGQVVWVDIDYTINYNDGSFDQEVSGSRETFYATDGYSLFTEGVNAEGTTGMLFPNVTYKVGDSDSVVIPVNLGRYHEDLDIYLGYVERCEADGGTVESTCANIGWHSVRYTSAEGNTYTETVDLTGTSAADRIKLIPAGVVNGSNWLNAGGYASEYPDGTAYYTIELLDGLGQTIDSRTFEYECEPKYDEVQIAYLNKYGVWDYMTFFKASRETMEVEREEYQKTLGSVNASGFSYGSYSAQFQRYNTNSKKYLTLNTGWVDEGYKAKVEELLMSENVLILSLNRSVATGSGETYRLVQEIDDAIIQETSGFLNLETFSESGLFDVTQTPYAMKVRNNSVELQKDVNNKVINYTLELDYAFYNNLV